MKKAAKDTFKITLKGAKKSDLPSYVDINGVIYEKITGKTGTIELDLDPDVQKSLKSKMIEGHYVNEQELIRDVVRNMVKTTI